MKRTKNKEDLRRALFAGNFTKFAALAGLSKAELAAMAGVTVRTVNNWIACPAGMKLGTFVKLIEAIDMPDEAVLEIIRAENERSGSHGKKTTA